MYLSRHTVLEYSVSLSSPIRRIRYLLVNDKLPEGRSSFVREMSEYGSAIGVLISPISWSYKAFIFKYVSLKLSGAACESQRGVMDLSIRDITSAGASNVASGLCIAKSMPYSLSYIKFENSFW